MNGDREASETGGEETATGTGVEPSDVDAAVLAELWTVVRDRAATRPDGSYTAALLDDEKGENAVLEKLGEETTELLLAAKDDDADDLAHEAADLVYHLLVLFAAKDVPIEALFDELEARRE